MGSNVLVLIVQSIHLITSLPFIMKLLLVVFILAQVFAMGSSTACETVAMEVVKLGEDLTDEVKEASSLTSSEHVDQNALLAELQDSIDWLKKAVKSLIRGKKGYGLRGFGGYGYGGYGRKYGHHGHKWY